MKNTNNNKWPALLRGTVISATISKHMSYIALADRKAQNIITINAFLVPISLTGIRSADFRVGTVIAIITAITSILFAIISLLPKKYYDKHHKDELLHFSAIQYFSEDEYVKELGRSLKDESKIGKIAAQDIYHMSKNILVPKFRWIHHSYITFLIGNFIALSIIIFNILI